MKQEVLRKIENLLESDELFTVVTWPEIQYYMTVDGFDENSHLIDDNEGLDEYGSSSYMVSVKWMLQMDLFDNPYNNSYNSPFMKGYYYNQLFKRLVNLKGVHCNL